MSEGAPPHPIPPASVPPDVPVRSKHTARWVGVAVLVIAAGLTAVLATRPQATTAQAASPLLGKQSPAIAGVTVNGTHYAMPSQPGKYMVVNFFASWCEPCQQEEPELVQFQYEHQRSGDASMLSVVIQDTVPAARAYQESQGATWPTMADPQGAIRLDYGVGSPPSTFVIAPDGRVIADYLGPVTAKDLNTVIARAETARP